MPSWNKTHYERAAQFLRGIADAIPAARSGDVAPSAPSPHSVAAAEPSLPKATAAPAAHPSPTAGSVFKKIPWKK